MWWREVAVGRELAAGVWRELALVLRRKAVRRRGGGDLVRAGDEHADRTETVAQRKALLEGLLELRARRARLALDAVAMGAYTPEVSQSFFSIDEGLIARTFRSAADGSLIGEVGAKGLGFVHSVGENLQGFHRLRGRRGCAH